MKYFLLVCAFFLLPKNTWAQWERHIIDSIGSGADGLKFSDINNDGKLDIVTGWEESGMTKIYLQPKLKDLKNNWTGVVVGKTPNVEDALFFDVNNDSRIDVISVAEGISKKLLYILILKITTWIPPIGYQKFCLNLMAK